MATLNKNFRIKNGLVVEGSTATVNGQNILTETGSDQYIINLIGGTATPDNTANAVVKRDENGNFAAGAVTVESLNISGIGTISDDDELLIAASSGEDIRLTADDVRVEAVDDFRVEVGGDILLQTTGVGNNVYIGSIDSGNEVVTESILDSHIGDGTVDGTAGNTVYDRIFNAKAEAIADAGTATDTKLADYTTTANLDTTIDGYGYLKSADLSGYATETYADTAASNAQTAAQNYADTAAGNAQTAAESYADGLAVNYDAAGSASAAEAAANTYTDNAVNALDTDDIEEGSTNKYFSDTLARGAFSVTSGMGLTYDSANGLFGVDTNYVATNSYVDSAIANLVDGAPALLDTLNEIAAAINDDENYFTTVSNAIATKQNTLTAGANIDITDDTISVTGLDTDDVAEGGNLYFTDSRARDAVDGTDRSFTSVSINDVSKSVASTTGNIVTASATTALSWAKADYRSAKIIVKAKNGSHTHVSEVILTLDTSDNIALNEYAMTTTNGSLMTIDADISGADVRLRVTPAHDNTEVMTHATLLV